jgi:arylsulfatase A-like enzyme
MDTHHPYEPPSAYFESLKLNTDRSRTELGEFSRTAVADGEPIPETDLADIVAAYRACCAYLGDELLAFVKSLTDRGHFDSDRDVLVVTADHGECFSPRKLGTLGHTPPAFWDNVIQVPLVVAHPEWGRMTVTDQVSLIDLMPTILNAAGVNPPETAVGQAAAMPGDLARKNAYAVSQPYVEDGHQRTYRMVRAANGWKLFGADRDNDEVILSRHANPDGERPVFETTPAEDETPEDPSARNAWKQLHADLDDMRGPVEVEVDRDVDDRSEELTDHLRSLGYID